MSAFTTESAVRLKFQLTDTTLVPSDLITTSINDAHAELLRYLNPDYDVEPPEDALVQGETLLAGAHLYRSLAAKEAFSQKHVAVGSQRIEPGERFTSLMTIATLTEGLAWYMLEPYVLDQPARALAAATDTTPVIGE